MLPLLSSDLFLSLARWVPQCSLLSSFLDWLPCPVDEFLFYLI